MKKLYAIRITKNTYTKVSHDLWQLRTKKYKNAELEIVEPYGMAYYKDKKLKELDFIDRYSYIRKSKVEILSYVPVYVNLLNV